MKKFRYAAVSGDSEIIEPCRLCMKAVGTVDCVTLADGPDIEIVGVSAERGIPGLRMKMQYYGEATVPFVGASQ